MQIFVKISPNFFQVSESFSDFDRSDVKMMISHKNLRKVAEIIKNFVAKILKICLKKMYTLNRYGGNRASFGIPCMWLPAPRAANVMLFLHGNAEDLGMSALAEAGLADSGLQIC